MDPKTLEKLNHLALTDEVPADQIMEMARLVDCNKIVRHHDQIQTNWRARILVTGVMDVGLELEGVEAVILDFTNTGSDWSLKKSMQVLAADGYDAKALEKKFERATGPIRTRVGSSRDIFYSLARQFSYARHEINPMEGDVWLSLAAKGERFDSESVARARQDVMEKKTPVAGPGKAQPRM